MNRARGTTWVSCLSLCALIFGCDDSSDSNDTMATTMTTATTPPGGSADAGDDCDGDDDGDDGDGSSSSPPDDPMDDDGAPPMTTGAEDDGGAETGGMGGEETGVGDDATTGMEAGICDPVPGDDPCDACTKLSCCPQLMACEADATCSCFIGCVEGGGDPFGCSGECGADLFGAGATAELVTCSSGPCGGSCV